ncbi:MAG TPA: hypothetical protein VLM89_13860, partial [Phycisphaerae bacterium]|nr:hypothetical protein [Phycisphaerae bacterium]
SVIEPYEQQSRIANIRRLELTDEKGAGLPEPCVAVEIRLADGHKDLVVTADREIFLGHRVETSEPPQSVQADWRARFEANLAFVRLDSAGKVERIAMCRARSARIGDVEVKLRKFTDFIEIAFEGAKARVVGGDKDAVQDVTIGGKSAVEKAD